MYNFAPVAPLLFTSPVVFEGAYFSGYDVALPYFELYYNNVLVGTSATLLLSDVSTLLSSGYGGLVDRVDVISATPQFFVMDDLTYSPAAPVPGPVAGAGLPALLFGGLLAAWWRRRQKAAQTSH